jgi:hypothetical protein
MGALALALASASGARAQEQPSSGGATDTNAISQVFEDSSSEACDAKNGSSPNVDGYDPAFCMKQTTTTGKCAPIGGADTTLAGQAGNTCYYCQQNVFPASYTVFVVAMDAASAAYKQGFTCSAVLSDAACYLACYGTGKFAPPAGTSSKGGGTSTGSGTEPTSGPPPIKNENQRSPLVGHLIYDAPDACHPAGVEQYNVCDYPNLPRPAGCTCSTNAKPQPAVKPSTNTPAAAPLQAASDFSDQMRAAAETMMQNAGRISKAMTDSMNPATHNNVGINVMLMSSLGALGKTMSFVAEQYQAIAAAKVAASAAEQAAILEIAGESAADSGTLASEAEQAAAQAAKTGSASAGAPVGTAMGTLGGNMVGLLPYQEGMVYLGKTVIQTTGDLPYCGVLSCARLGQLLKANASLTKAFESVQVGAQGSTPQQMVAGLQQMGINAQIATGPAAGATMAKLLGQGQPLIAGVEIFGPGGTPLVGTSGLHAVVIEAAETLGGVQGFRIYDPAGWYYWQPIETFFKYSSGVIVHAL